MSDNSSFAKPSSAKDAEEGLAFAPKFDSSGLVTAVVTDSTSGDVLMVAHMNAEALRKTIDTGEAHYFSRSRNTLWRKGESSGHTQRVVEMRVDCDQDAVWIKVVQEGEGACHTGRRSCFYRAVPLGKAGAVTLEFRDGEKTFDPDKDVSAKTSARHLWRARAAPAPAPDAGGHTSRHRCRPRRRRAHWQMHRSRVSHARSPRPSA